MERVRMLITACLAASLAMGLQAKQGPPPASGARGQGAARGVMALAASIAAGLPSAAQAPASAVPSAPQDLLVLAPKQQSPGWTGVHRPHTRLADVLARHKGEADWAETVVDDESLFAQWISMGLPRRLSRT
jgi:hypothetical protein